MEKEKDRTIRICNVFAGASYYAGSALFTALSALSYKLPSLLPQFEESPDILPKLLDYTHTLFWYITGSLSFAGTACFAVLGSALVYKGITGKSNQTLEEFICGLETEK